MGGINDEPDDICPAKLFHLSKKTGHMVTLAATFGYQSSFGSEMEKDVTLLTSILPFSLTNTIIP